VWQTTTTHTHTHTHTADVKPSSFVRFVLLILLDKNTAAT